jgi:hypothetical protein
MNELAKIRTARRRTMDSSPGSAAQTPSRQSSRRANKASSGDDVIYPRRSHRLTILRPQVEIAKEERRKTHRIDHQMHMPMSHAEPRHLESATLSLTLNFPIDNQI